MVLARLLRPDTFGVVAVITMVVTFIDMFTDAGFQKYLVQHEFKNEFDKYKSATIAFWTNLCISLFLWLLIAIFNDKLAKLVGIPGLGIVIVVACISLPLTSFSSIQAALHKRDLNYRTLFMVRITGVCVPFFVTIPLVLFGLSYWAMVAGIICSNLSNAIILTVKSRWKPELFFDFSLLKEMISFSIWTLFEEISIWLTSWIDLFIVGSTLSFYYLGIYRTSMNTVNSILGIVTGAMTSIVFSVLSRFQNDEKHYKEAFFKFQKAFALFVLPMGAGIYLYRDLITGIFLGGQWQEASMFIGLWGVMYAMVIVLCNFCSIAYVSQGRPKLSTLAQLLHILVLVPVVYISKQYSFNTLIYARSLIWFQFILVQLVLVYFILKISPIKMLKNIMAPIICSLAMGGSALLFRHFGNNIIWNSISIILCAIFYFICIMQFPSLRNEIINLYSQHIKTKMKSSSISSV